MSQYWLSATAQSDLSNIRGCYSEVANLRVARRMIAEFVAAFRFLANNRGAGHRREDLAGGLDLRVWPMRSYLIFYRPRTKPLQIVGVVHGNRDVRKILSSRGN